MSIWFSTPDLAALELVIADTMDTHIGIRLTAIGDDYLSASMPVDQRTMQPMGLLHGGASVALAETLGSLAANCVVDRARHACVGQEINANHLRPVRGGIVTGTARPVHLGARSQVWQIHIVDEKDRLVCISRLTMAVLDRSRLTPQPA